MFRTLIDKISTDFKYINQSILSCEKDIHELIEIITRSQKIYFTGVGKSFNIANHCCDLLKSVGLTTYAIDPLNALHGDVGTIKKNDVCLFFSNSGNTIELMNLIEHLNYNDVTTIGICSNKSSMFKKMCTKTVILPKINELEYNGIKSIPTNSCLVQLIFSNIITILMIQKLNLSIESYKNNHPAGNIGNNLKKLKDVLIEKYVVFQINENKKIKIKKILLEMSINHIGCSLFVDDDKKLIGILSDGDIRNLFLQYENLDEIEINMINRKCKYETNIEKMLINYDNNLKYLPIVDDNKVLIGIAKLN
jgi:arabinose-5-phosphate isomerase